MRGTVMILRKPQWMEQPYVTEKDPLNEDSDKR